VSSTNTNTVRETLKIKKAFSNLQNKKIENIQVIVPINLDNANKFIKDSSIHVTNINRVLKNIKSDIMANFICIKNREVIITINKVTEALDLQTIERYIKNMNNIKAN